MCGHRRKHRAFYTEIPPAPAGRPSSPVALGAPRAAGRGSGGEPLLPPLRSSRIPVRDAGGEPSRLRGRRLGQGASGAAPGRGGAVRHGAGGGCCAGAERRPRGRPRAGAAAGPTIPYSGAAGRGGRRWSRWSTRRRRSTTTGRRRRTTRRGRPASGRRTGRPPSRCYRCSTCWSSPWGCRATGWCC